MTKLPLPFIHRFPDRHGTMRHYFRKRGFKVVALPGEPLSPEFMDAYRAAAAGHTSPKLANGGSKSRPGTIAAAVAGYLGSARFQGFASDTKKPIRNILDRFREEHGEKPVATLGRQHIDRMLASRSSKPSAARNFLKAIRSLMTWAVAAGLREDNPTDGLRSAPIRTSGYRSWTDDDIAAFEAQHPVGTMARLAFALLLYTAQRRTDVVKLGPQHIRNGEITVRQQKTGAALVIPIHEELKRVLAATPSGQLAFLVTQHGQPFTRAGFGGWFRDRCNEAGLHKGTAAHGLRKAACRRLAEAGCSANQIAAISGHISLREVQRYTAAAEQRRMAQAAMKAVTAAFPTEHGEQALANRATRVAKSSRNSLKRKG